MAARNSGELRSLLKETKLEDSITIDSFSPHFQATNYFPPKFELMLLT